MTADNQDYLSQAQSSAGPVSDREKAEAEITRERAREAVKEDYHSQGLWKRLRANLDFIKATDIEKKSQEIELSAAEKELLDHIYSATDQLTAELETVYRRLEKKSIFQKAAEKSPTAARILSSPATAETIGIGAGLWAGLKSSAVRKGIRSASAAIFSFSPIVGGAIGGAIAGGISAGLKERARVYQVKSWEQESGIPEIAGVKTLEDAQKLSQEQLEKAIGVLGNAFSDHKVRDNASQTLHLAAKYRLLVRAREGERAGNIFQALNRIETADQELDNEIIKSAKEQYQKNYQEILKGKGRSIWKKAGLGALTGGAWGALIGTIAEVAHPLEVQAQEPLPKGPVQHLGPKYEEWLNRHYDKIGVKEVATKHGIERVALVNLNSHNQIIPTEAAHHLGYVGPDGRITGVAIHPDIGYINHIKAVDNQWGFGQMVVLEDGSRGYITDEKALSSFIDKIITGQWQGEQGAYRIAEMRNIDLRGAVTKDGQSLFDFIRDNRENFLKLDILEQKHILSNPDQAQTLLKEGLDQIKEEIAKERAAKTVRSLILGGIVVASAVGLGLWKREAIKGKLGGFAKTVKSRFSGFRSRQKRRSLNKRNGYQKRPDRTELPKVHQHPDSGSRFRFSA